MIKPYSSELEYTHSKSALLSSYRAITSDKGKAPEWAVHKRNSPNELVHCTIPFIGKQYGSTSPRILIYASAENLSGYYKGNDSEWTGDWLDDDGLAEDRHRYCFSNSSDKFYPNVHISPMNCGALALASYYLSIKIRETEDPAMLPSKFYETVAFGNYAKYSIETPLQRQKRLRLSASASRANIDYASRKELLQDSHPYIDSDLRILQPDVVILPGSIYKTDKEFLDRFEGICFIPIYQINSQVINLYISKEYAKADLLSLPFSVQTWYSNLQHGGITGKTKENYLAVFRYLDDLYSKLN